MDDPSYVQYSIIYEYYSKISLGCNIFVITSGRGILFIGSVQNYFSNELNKLWIEESSFKTKLNKLTYSTSCFISIEMRMFSILGTGFLQRTMLTFHCCFSEGVFRKQDLMLCFYHSLSQDQSKTILAVN